MCKLPYFIRKKWISPWKLLSHVGWHSLKSPTSTTIYYNTWGQVPSGTDQIALAGQSKLKVPWKFISPKGLWVPFPIKVREQSHIPLHWWHVSWTVGHRTGVTNTFTALENLEETVGFGSQLTDSQVNLRVQCILLAEPHKYLMLWFCWRGEEMSFSIDPK